ncbi:MAG TPA: SpoIVB peptidase S55 domain-containing protein [Polyangia bacterium]|nr:SpoIVB peptidase S55 domain-containing protein [Polyangia bacterium]
MTRPSEQPRSTLSVPPAPAIMPLSEVKSGMVGEAWTVFRGVKPEPFKIRVVSILRNFIPRQDVILMRAEDPRVEFSGIAAGMSGSPVYINGKLVGAIAYAWSFSKEPLAGVTPIETMLAERQRPRRANDDLLANNEPAGLPRVASRNDNPNEPRLTTVSVPLSISGVSTVAMNDLADDLKPFGLVPVRVGGGGRRKQGLPVGIDKLEPGAPVGVELVRGDMSAVAMGTLTYVQGDKLVAFGHPMFGIGEVNLPLVLGEVHAFMPSMAASFKMASPIAEIGAVTQDRPSCIVGDLSRHATMVPIEVRVNAPDLERRTFRAEVARNRRLTPVLASMVITSAIADTEPDVTEMAVSITSRLDVRNYGKVELKDQLFSNEGLSPRLLGSSRGVRALSELLSNPFEPAVVDRLDIDVQIEFRRDLSEIVSVALSGDSVRAGDVVSLRVIFKPYAGPEFVETVPVKIPSSMAGQSVKVEVAAGGLVRPDVAKPESLRGYIENLRSFYTASSIVVSLNTPDDGASLRGRLIPNLPEAALDTLRTGSQTRRADAYRVAERTVFTASKPVTGRQELTLIVREDALGKNR